MANVMNIPTTKGYVDRSLATVQASVANLAAQVTTLDTKLANILLPDDIMGVMAIEDLNELKAISAQARAVVLDHDRSMQILMGIIANLGGGDSDVDSIKNIAEMKSILVQARAVTIDHDRSMQELMALIANMNGTITSLQQNIDSDVAALESRAEQTDVNFALIQEELNEALLIVVGMQRTLNSYAPLVHSHSGEYLPFAVVPIESGGTANTTFTDNELVKKGTANQLESAGIAVATGAGIASFNLAILTANPSVPVVGDLWIYSTGGTRQLRCVLSASETGYVDFSLLT